MSYSVKLICVQLLREGISLPRDDSETAHVQPGREVLSMCSLSDLMDELP